VSAQTAAGDATLKAWQSSVIGGRLSGDNIQLTLGEQTHWETRAITDGARVLGFFAASRNNLSLDFSQATLISSVQSSDATIGYAQGTAEGFSGFGRQVQGVLHQTSVYGIASFDAAEQEGAAHSVAVGSSLMAEAELAMDISQSAVHADSRAVAVNADAYAEANAFTVRSFDGRADVVMKSSQFASLATATVSGGDGTAFARAFGGSTLATPATMLTMVDSRIEASAMTSDDGESVGAQATGLNWEGIDSAQLMMTGSEISAEAVAGGAQGRSAARGVALKGVDAAQLALSDGSVITARAQADSDDALSFGVRAAESTVDIQLDATSMIAGDWAVSSNDATVTVTNHGVLSGRLQVETLTNGATGTLEARLGGDTFLYHADQDNTFYFTADQATMDAGSTLAVDFDADITLAAEGDVTAYALLSSTEGDWNIGQLQLVSNDASPLLELGWHDATDADQLIVQARYLTPVQAGLSRNATVAYRAAVADGLFTFRSAPSLWGPDVSGAVVAGMNHVVASSATHIDHRLRSMMGNTVGQDAVDAQAANNGLWYSTRFSGGEQDNRHGISGYEAHNAAMSIGYDHRKGDMVLGVAYTRGKTDADSHDHRAEFDMSDNLFSLYGSYEGNRWYAKAILSAGRGSVDGLRQVEHDSYASDYDTHSYDGHVEMGLTRTLQGWQVHPLVALEYSVQRIDDYRETGAGRMALQVDSQHYESLTAAVGVHIKKDFQRSFGVVSPEVSGRVSYDLESDRIATTSHFIGGSTPFLSEGIEPCETRWDLGAALTIASLEEQGNDGAQGVRLRVGYDFTGGSDYQAHSFSARVVFTF
jgi:hypothetical protein